MKKVPLSRGLFALVSDEDFEIVSAYKWCASHESRGFKHYAIRWETICGRRFKIRMHRFIMGLPHGDPRVVDHLDGDGLDNRRENLEVVDQRENMLRVPGWKRRSS